MQKRIIFLLLIMFGIPAVVHAQQPIPLGLKEAVDAALEPEGNTRMQLAREAVRQAEARAAQVRAALLPDVSVSIGQQSRTRSLTEMGLRSEELPNGLQLPNVVGPFNTFDARGTATLRLFDLGALKHYQAAQISAAASKTDTDSAAQKVSAEVARAYLLAVRAQAMVDTANANVELSNALLRLASSQKETGTGTGIDVTRAEVQLANNRQQQLAAQSDFTKARLELLKTLGIELDVNLVLIDALSFQPANKITLEQALGTANESLAELRAQLQREQSAAVEHKATALERLPSVVGFADYGTVGLSGNHTTPTRTYGASIQIPIFDGGRRDARRSESLSLLKQERIRTGDLKDRVELEIRIALDAVESAEAQVHAAEKGLSLATDELQQAERRYQAGVGTSIEVTDAQTRLQRSRENRIAAIYAHSRARVDLAAATGNINDLISTWR